MSKLVKGMIADQLKKSLDNVESAVLVNMVGLTANQANQLRGELEAKNIRVLVIRNLLAARATEGTCLNPLFKGLAGSSAICWGSEDIVSLAKEIIRLTDDKRFEKFEPKGGIMDGEAFSAAMVRDISKWPSRVEQLSMLVGQIMGPGSQLASALIGPAGALASQIAQKAEGEEEAPAEAPAEAAAV